MNQLKIKYTRIGGFAKNRVSFQTFLDAKKFVDATLHYGYSSIWLHDATAMAVAEAI